MERSPVWRKQEAGKSGKRCEEKKPREKNESFQYWTEMKNESDSEAGTDDEESERGNKFVWSKKIEKRKQEGLSRQEIKRIEILRRRENEAELEKVKRRKREREIEKELQQREIDLLAREREMAKLENWEEKEENFHLEQARIRSKIRLEQGRAKPIDILARYISSSNKGRKPATTAKDLLEPEEEEEQDEEIEEIDIHEPYLFLNHLNLNDLEDLKADIEIFQNLDGKMNEMFWKDMLFLCENKIKVLKTNENGKSGEGRESLLNKNIEKDVITIFQNKTYEQLKTLEDSIVRKLNSGGTVDVNYWEGILDKLIVEQTKSRLKTIHEKILKEKFYRLKEKKNKIILQQQQQQKNQSSIKDEQMEIVNQTWEHPPENTHATILKQTKSEKDAEGSVKDDDEDEEEVIEEEEDETYLKKKREEMKAIVLNQKLKYSNRISSMNYTEEENRLFKEESQRAMEEEEEVFQGEFEMAPEEKKTLASCSSSGQETITNWDDKYRPRKPRYFNRVNAGYEWNRYNRTHYDVNNPPPKVIKGYKFNLFYPDLIDPTKPPEYSFLPCEGEKDFCIIKFHAGPPYEDVAFKIIVKEWEYSQKDGFKCCFDRGIFQLWFNFRRYRYRR